MNRPEPVRNVLLILTDQHRAAATGYAGDPLAETPSLDRLAAGGVVFSGAHTPSPVCVPARQSLITGRYPHAHGALTNSQSLGPHEVTLGHVASTAGMATGAIGKMHFAGPERHYGFAERWDYQDYARAEPDAAGDAASGMAYKDRYGVRAEGHALPTLPATNPLDRAYLAGPSPFLAERHVESYIARETVRFLEAHRHERFLLVCSFFKPHDPMMPPPPFWERYARREVPLPQRSGDGDAQLPAAMRRRRAVLGVEHFQDEQWRDAIRGYYGNLAFVDEQIGLVLSTLEALGLQEETLVVYASDHGELIGRHREAGKQVFYDASWRVPLIVSHPHLSQRRGATVSGLVDLVDVFPTIVEAADLHLPDGAPPVHGRSLLGIAAGAELGVRDHVFSQLHGRPGTGATPHYGIRTQDWKLALYDPGEEQLFDLRQDPEERHNVYAEHPDQVTTLRELLEADLKLR